MNRKRMRMQLKMVRYGVVGLLLLLLSVMVGVSGASDLAQQTPVTHNADWTPVVQNFGGIPMVQVPAGCFLMGSTDVEVEKLAAGYDGVPSFDGEAPQHEQCFTEPFWISQTEVTNAQYQAFMSAGGYSRSSYWTAAGSSWRSTNKVKEPIFWADSTDNQPDQPVVGVSWYEADAFGKWLSTTMTDGETFRLPTEREWEYAARGPDGLIYPWGNEWNADNVPGDILYTGSASVVGSHPQGVSWVGALDMSGNAWERVSSVYSFYPYAADDGREDADLTDIRVIRGGSPLILPQSAVYRAAYRYGERGFRQTTRHPAVGFRVVMIPPPAP